MNYTITLKLIGTPTYDYNILSHDVFKFIDIYNIIKNKGITVEELTKIRYFYNGAQILDYFNEYTIKQDKIAVIYVFIQDEVIKNNLIKFIFTSPPAYNTIDLLTPLQVIDKDVIENTIIENTIIENTIIENTILPDSSNDIMERNTLLPVIEDSSNTLLPVIEDNIISKINTNIIEQFKDEDFVNLLRICITKPHLLEVVNSYMSHGNVVKCIDMVEMYDFKYDDIYNIIRGMNIMKTSDDIMLKNVINHFKGHINHCIRYILYKQL